MNKKDWILIGLIALMFGVIGFSVAKLFTKKEILLTLPDYSKYEKKVDSLNNLYKKSQDTIEILYKHIDSLKLSRIKNNQNINNDIKKIKTFTPDSRKRYMDSVYRADHK